MEVVETGCNLEGVESGRWFRRCRWVGDESGRWLSLDDDNGRDGERVWGGEVGAETGRWRRW